MKQLKYITWTMLIIIGAWMVIYNFYHLFDSLDSLIFTACSQEVYIASLGVTWSIFWLFVGKAILTIAKLIRKIKYEKQKKDI